MPESLPLQFLLNAAVGAFELKMESGQECCVTELANFLPPINHCEYRDTLVELVRVDLEYGWSRGTPKLLDEYFHHFPDLKKQSQMLNAVCFEEHRQKILAGRQSDARSYESLYGVSVDDWRLSRSVPTSSHRLMDDAQDKMDGLPSVGDSFLGFELIAELGRGSFARVFLARQLSLSNRMVALKVTKNRYSDSKTLARLQHTNIIPVYSVQQHRDWEAICMPYFGALTVNHLLGKIRRQPSLPPSGKFIHDTVVDVRRATLRDIDGFTRDTRSETSAPESPAPQIHAESFHALTGMSYTKSILLIAKKLASGLAYAHSRGIVHRDLKPANLLLSDDGEPMILDFNLSMDFVGDSDVSQEFIGGTLPYMAPEQLANFERQSKSIADPRSDLFSLGIVLYELLIGTSPYTMHQGNLGDVISKSIADRQRGPLWIGHREATVSPAIESILAKCLTPQVEDRYQTAQALVDDLECQLNDLPLRHAPERSLQERAQKWVRRHPRVMSVSGVVAAAAVLLLAMMSVLAIRNERLASFESQVTWKAFQDLVRDAKVKVTRSAVAESSAVNESIAACDAALNVYRIDATQLWKSLPSVEKLESEQRSQLSRDAAELLFHKATSLGLKTDFATGSSEKEQIRSSALSINELARDFYQDTEFEASLERQSKWLSQEPIVIAESLSPSELASASTRNICEQASLLSAQRRFREASHLWQTASMRDPQNLWVWHGLGYSLEQIGSYSRAAECYSVCISLNPKDFTWYFNRGNTRIRSNEFELAAADFTKAIELDPDNPESHINRAIALLELQQHSAAQVDINEAISLGFDDPQVYLLLAQSSEELGNRKAADSARVKADSSVPKNAASWIARGVSHASLNPEQALQDFDKALQLNAHSLPALESKASVLAETLRKTDDAIGVLDEAVRLFPEAAEIRAGRGVLHARLIQTSQALHDAQHALSLDSSPAVMYRVAGIYSLLSTDSDEHRQRATELLALSLNAGYGAEWLDTDPDLDAIRTFPDFRKLREAAGVFQRHSIRYIGLD